MVDARPPSPSANLPSESSIFYPLEFIVEFWKWESTRLMSKDLFQCYESQRDLFLITQKLGKSEWLNHSEFLRHREVTTLSS